MLTDRIIIGFDPFTDSKVIFYAVWLESYIVC